MNPIEKKYSRRDFLKIAGMATAGTVLTACQPAQGPRPAPEATLTQQPQTAPTETPAVTVAPTGFVNEGSDSMSTPTTEIKEEVKAAPAIEYFQYNETIEKLRTTDPEGANSFTRNIQEVKDLDPRFKDKAIEELNISTIVLSAGNEGVAPNELINISTTEENGVVVVNIVNSGKNYAVNQPLIASGMPDGNVKLSFSVTDKDGKVVNFDLMQGGKKEGKQGVYAVTMDSKQVFSEDSRLTWEGFEIKGKKVLASLKQLTPEPTATATETFERISPDRICTDPNKLFAPGTMTVSEQYRISLEEKEKWAQTIVEMVKDGTMTKDQWAFAVVQEAGKESSPSFDWLIASVPISTLNGRSIMPESDWGFNGLEFYPPGLDVVDENLRVMIGVYYSNYTKNEAGFTRLKRFTGGSLESQDLLITDVYDVEKCVGSKRKVGMCSYAYDKGPEVSEMIKRMTEKESEQPLTQDLLNKAHIVVNLYDK